MNPAWPRDSSPEMPITRFSDTAITIQQQMGTSWPFRERVMVLLAIMDCRMKNAPITSAKVTIL